MTACVAVNIVIGTTDVAALTAVVGVTVTCGEVQAASAMDNDVKPSRIRSVMCDISVLPNTVNPYSISPWYKEVSVSTFLQQRIIVV
jgi:hypothetical protein